MALSNKHQTFVNEYLVCWNASEAARRAGYNGKANVVGPRLLADVSITEEIKRRVAERAMTADEVLIRLAEHARGNMAEFVKFYDEIKTPFLDLRSANEKGLLCLVKKFKYNASGQPEIELYDAQAALVQLGKVHGLFRDVQEHTGSVGSYSMTKDEWEKERNRSKQQASNTIADFEDEEPAGDEPIEAG